MNAFSSENLPLTGRGRLYSFVVLRRVSTHPRGIRFMELYRTLHGHTGISKPCLSYTLHELIREQYLYQAATGLYIVTRRGKEYLNEIEESEDEFLSRIVDFVIGKVEERIGKPFKDAEERKSIAGYLCKRIRLWIESEAHDTARARESKTSKP